MLNDLQEVLKLSELDVYELASSNEDATHFLAELAVLHKREVGANTCCVMQSHVARPLMMTSRRHLHQTLYVCRCKHARCKLVLCTAS